jgi:hypothetical protein
MVDQSNAQNHNEPLVPSADRALWLVSERERIQADNERARREYEKRSVATPQAEARRVAHELELPPHVWEQAGTPSGRWGCAQVCRVRPGRVLHVVGASEMAEQLREIYKSGAIVGWALQPMPDTRTPLHEYEYLLQLTESGRQPGSRRAYNQLGRWGFVWAEEVRATPDEALLGIRNLGQTALTKIRELLGDYTADANDSVNADQYAERQCHIRTLASASTLARYPELLHLLARSRMPVEAVDTICAALNGEQLPPIDPLAHLLLETAHEAELLALYRVTHTAGDE